MISQKRIGQIGVIAPLWFFCLYVIMSSRRPEYSHLHKAISELGSLDAPNLWIWNVLGYIVPGLAVSLLGFGLNREFSQASQRMLTPTAALVTSGLLMALSGVFPGDFQDRASATMILHSIGSVGSYAGFLIAGFWLPKVFRQHEGWRWIVWPSLALVVGSVATGFLRSGTAPGLGQRLAFACFFLWVGLVSIGLLRSGNRSGAV